MTRGFFEEVTGALLVTGYKGLLEVIKGSQGVSKGYRGFQIVTTGYKRLEGILRTFKG